MTTQDALAGLLAASPSEKTRLACRVFSELATSGGVGASVVAAIACAQEHMPAPLVLCASIRRSQEGTLNVASR